MTTETALSASELDRLLELAEKATPGPWWHARSISYRAIATLHPMEGGGYQPASLLPGEGAQGEADAAFMAAVDPDTIRQLVAAAREPLDVGRLAKAILVAAQLVAAQEEVRRPTSDGEWYASADEMAAAIHAALELAR